MIDRLRAISLLKRAVKPVTTPAGSHRWMNEAQTGFTILPYFRETIGIYGRTRYGACVYAGGFTEGIYGTGRYGHSLYYAPAPEMGRYGISQYGAAVYWEVGA